MKEIIEDNRNLDLNTNHSEVDNDFHLVYIFWLKVFFGIICGIIQYFSLRVFYYIGGFYINSIFRGFLIVSVLMMVILIFQSLIILLLYVSKKRFSRKFPQEEKVWRLSLRFTFVFFVVLVISASITFYIGF